MSETKPATGFKRATALPFSKPTIGDREVDAVTRVLRSGWITAGPETAKFEEELQAYTGAKHALTFTSATSALHLCLSALELKPGDEVITTPITWPATCNAIVLAGGKPVFVDVDEKTRSIDVGAIKRAFTKKTRAVVPVHFAGLAVDNDAIRAAAPGAFLLEDGAHAIGTKLRGKMIGATPDAVAFSFHPIKNVTTAEGGCITTNSDELARKLRLLRWHGVDKDGWKRHHGVGKASYDVEVPGYKANSTDIQSALGRIQLERLEGAIDRRAALAAIYKERLSGIEELELPAFAQGKDRHAWHLFTVLLDPARARMSRDDFMEALRERGIGTGLHFLAAHLLTYYRKTLGHKEGDLPHAERVGDRILSLPLFPDMRDEDVEDVARAIEAVLAK
ncbi:DegT/DnrJ/EryC1/StrS aminotransferase family protein [bacterium]|nr:DegT/DnrJ/EryC1/StrS aminotransferase family protein [bacterium]